MTRFAFRQVCFTLCGSLLTACQSVPKDAGFGDVQQTVSARTGLILRWDAYTTDDQSVFAAVGKLLSHELTSADAVQIALLNNHHLQATFEDLGIAQADLVQAGLLKNPIFDIGVRFPDRAPAITYLDIAVAEDFLDIVLLPARKKLAAGRFEQVKAQVANEVLALAAQTSTDFYDYQASEQASQLCKMMAQTAAASLNTARKLHEAGNTTELDLANERAQESRARADLIDAQSHAEMARESLSRQMGLLGTQTQWTATATLPDLPPSADQVDNLETLAVQQRLDLEAARQEIAIQARTLGITTDFRFFQELNVGPEFERESDGQWRIGPTISAPIPIFDQGQARTSRAAAVLRQSEQRYMAMSADVQSDVRLACAKLVNARSKALLYRDEVLPIHQEVINQTQLQVNGMFAGAFQLLDAKRQQIEVTRQYINALRDYWISRVELERAIGSRIPTRSSTTQPKPTG